LVEITGVAKPGSRGYALSDATEFVADREPRQKMFEIEEADPISAPPAGCEPVASPFFDPALGKIVGRCVV